jgi:hypothetical protein
MFPSKQIDSVLHGLERVWLHHAMDASRIQAGVDVVDDDAARLVRCSDARTSQRHTCDLQELAAIVHSQRLDSAPAGW